MTKIGTLAEMNVKPGDVVEFVPTGDYHTVLDGKRLADTNGEPINYDLSWDCVKTFRVVSRASDTQETKIGTLKELNVQPGDVVEFFSGWEGMYTKYIGKRMVGNEFYGVSFDARDGFSSACSHKFRIVSRASDTPKLWRDMTPEEKGALLLAMHEGKKVGVYSNGKWLVKSFMTFVDDYAYRIEPEPKVETVTMYGNDIRFSGFFKGHRITFNLIDGEPDCTSIKMEKL